MTTKFKNKGRSQTLDGYIRDKDDIYKHAIDILKEIWPLDPCRLIALRMSNLETEDKLTKGDNISKFFNNKVSTQEYFNEIAKAHQKSMNKEETKEA